MEVAGIQFDLKLLAIVELLDARRRAVWAPRAAIRALQPPAALATWSVSACEPTTVSPPGGSAASAGHCRSPARLPDSRAGVPLDVLEKLKAQEREIRELRQANEILRKASAYFVSGDVRKSPLDDTRKGPPDDVVGVKDGRHRDNFSFL